MSNNSYAAERQDNVIVPISDDSARNRLEKFYRTAFLPLRKEVDEGYQCYRVFVGRRCLVTAHRYVLQNRNRISQKVHLRTPSCPFQKTAAGGERSYMMCS